MWLIYVDIDGNGKRWHLCEAHGTTMLFVFADFEEHIEHLQKSRRVGPIEAEQIAAALEIAAYVETWPDTLTQREAGVARVMAAPANGMMTARERARHYQFNATCKVYNAGEPDPIYQEWKRPEKTSAT